MASELARIGKAIGSPARAAMINVLFDGQPHTAGELAIAAGVTSGTATGHLKILTEAGIIVVENHGRYRNYHMANSRIAHALEQLCGPDLEPVTSLRLSREQRRVRAARTCYDHLAGQLGVNLTRRLLEQAWIDDGFTQVTDTGKDALRRYFDIDPHQLTDPPTRRPLVLRCQDWTEQRDHIAGRLGALIAQAALHNQWVTRQPASRSLAITQAGHTAFEHAGVLVTSGCRDASQPRYPLQRSAHQ